MKIISSPMFLNDIKRLRKKYKKVKEDVDPILQKLKQGQKVGDRIQREEEVYKVRVQNSDTRRGKSGGYRLLYYVYTEEEIKLITIYSKSDSVGFSDKEVRGWLKNL